MKSVSTLVLDSFSCLKYCLKLKLKTYSESTRRVLQLLTGKIILKQSRCNKKN